MELQRILTEDLKTKRAAAKFVPGVLTDNQKERRINACRSLKKQFETEADLLPKVIITVDVIVTWLQPYKLSSCLECRGESQWKSPSSPRKSNVVKSNIKTILIYIFDAKGSS